MKRKRSRKQQPTPHAAPGAMWRQGDVLIVAVAELPDGLPVLDRRDPRGLVLAEGEATGHAHAIAWPSVGIAGSDGASLYFAAGSDGAQITHQEHATITLPAGFYRVVHQREYSPQEIRRVAD